ncbi:crosslink repair DNA glycosylase YcaQ family protein [Pseudonocardia tropica]|uniref:Crosslink repair DNA glycosylase YcaQ family protein n=1 Tax=Pseudonocardia tropica TaxID=681289 RepID=A0ABV1K374_9PSEU
MYLSALTRMTGGEVATIEKALYEDRSLIRMLGMRRSMFIVSRELAPVVQASCSRTIAAAQRRRLVKLLDGAGVGPAPGDWLADVETSVVAALRAAGEATAAELAEAEPRLRTSLVMAEGKPYEATQNITSRVLFQLAVDGHIVRGRPRGGWTTNTYRWSPMESWLPGGCRSWMAAPRVPSWCVGGSQPSDPRRSRT